MSDPINPTHYKHLPVEAIDIIEAAIVNAPSNESAYLQGQVLKYLLRCWSKKGIEDLRKAKWYLDRMVASFDEVLAEASGANETPIEPPRPSPTQPPSGYRLLGDAKDEPRIEGDSYWALANEEWRTLAKYQVFVANYKNWPTCRKIETPSDEPSEETDQDDHARDFKVGDAVISWQGREGVIEAIGLIEDFPITVRHSIREQVSYKLGGVKKKRDDHPGGKTPSEPPKHREPTKDDLKNGPIACEYRDSSNEQWRSGFLVYILNGAIPFLCVNKEQKLNGQWNLCRIEVAE